MLHNYLTVALRSLIKNRVYAVINILGLAIGMAACLLILLFLRYETSYDRWIAGVEDSYQLQTRYEAFGDQAPAYSQMAAYVAGPALRKDFPEIERLVYMLNGSAVVLRNGEGLKVDSYRFVNGNLLDVIDLPLVRGTKAAFSAPDTMLLTRREAIARFGSDDVIGRVVSTVSQGRHRDYRVVGVLADLPRNSSLQINALIHTDFRNLLADQPGLLTSWGEQTGWIYLKLRHGTDAQALERRFPAWEKRNIPDDDIGDIHHNEGDHANWHLVNLAGVHLGEAQGGAQTPGNDTRSLTTFAVIAFLILGMAVVNFTNLATARASQRAREVALRKVLGASRMHLISQFIGESILVAMIAMLIALALVELALPALSRFLAADLQLRYFGRQGVIPPVIGLVLVVGVLGGLYPALFLSRFAPAAVLRANRSAAETPGSGRLRSVLVVAQFAVSIGLIICTGVVYAQTVYARTVDTGFRRANILQVANLDRPQLATLGDRIVARVARVPGVDAVGRTTIGLDTGRQSTTSVLAPGNPRQVLIGNYQVDQGFLEAMGQRLVAGRWFDQRALDDATLPDTASDAAQRALAARGVDIVVNELAAHALGFASPAAAIGRQIRIGLVEARFGLVPATIIGVINGARYRSVRDPVEPIMFQSLHGGQTTLVVRYHGDPKRARAGVERVWKSFSREVPFDARFSEAIVGALYREDDARAEAFAGFALLSVIVGCLGLFGLASFTAERRTKEIGIRKVLGARTRDIVRLLVWQFSRPVLIANAIAWPVSWWVMRDWLNQFDARVALGPLPFLGAGALALLIAVVTIGGHALRVARANPINALRYE